jgi:hypothetical protein
MGAQIRKKEKKNKKFLHERPVSSNHGVISARSLFPHRTGGFIRAIDQG